MGESLPKIDGAVEEERDEVLVTPLEVPFADNQRPWLRVRRKAHDVPEFEIFPHEG